MAPLADLFGKPREGLHAYRTTPGDFALIDILGTLALAWLIANFFGFSYLPTLLGTFLLGEFLHWVLGVKTRFILLMSEWLPRSS